LRPIRHSCPSELLAFHLSKSSSVHCRVCNGAKSRKIMACLPSDPESFREAVPRSRNLSISSANDKQKGAYFCEVESGMVVSSRDRTVRPRSNLFLECQCLLPIVEDLYAPGLAPIVRIVHVIGNILIIGNNEDTTLITKLVGVGTLLDHRPCKPSIRR
jgi:hypothetical protein